MLNLNSKQSPLHRRRHLSYHINSSRKIDSLPLLRLLLQNSQILPPRKCHRLRPRNSQIDDQFSNSSTFPTEIGLCKSNISLQNLSRIGGMLLWMLVLWGQKDMNCFRFSLFCSDFHCIKLIWVLL